MKRFVIGFLMALCLVLIAVPARAAQGSASWYIDEDSKTLYINGQGYCGKKKKYSQKRHGNCKIDFLRIF